jgi:hypothetical protein
VRTFGRDSNGELDVLAQVQVGSSSEHRDVGLYFWLGLLVSSLALSVRALKGSLGEQFPLGTFAALVRASTVLPLGALMLAIYFPRLTGPLPWLGPVALVAVAAMPAASFTAIVQAYRKTLNVSAADEERASRPFNAWLPVAIADAIVVVIALLTLVLLRPWK